MQERIELFKDGCFGGSGFGFVSSDIQVLDQVLDCGCSYSSALRPASVVDARASGTSPLTLFDSRLKIPVHPQYMLRDHAITLLVRVVRDHKQ